MLGHVRSGFVSNILLSLVNLVYVRLSKDTSGCQVMIGLFKLHHIMSGNFRLFKAL
jgi:hypothetical protein